MATSIYRGGIYDVDWGEGRGSEQGGIRPSLVIQNDIANKVAAYTVTIVLPLSTKLKGYPSTVRVDPSSINGLNAPSEVNAGQIFTVDKERLGKHWGVLSSDDMQKVEEKLAYMLSLSAI